MSLSRRRLRADDARLQLGIGAAGLTPLDTYGVVVIGSGSSGMTAALTAQGRA